MDKVREIIIKINIVVGCVFGILIFGIPVISAIFGKTQFNMFYSIWIVDLILFAVSGVTLMILLVIWGLKLKPQKAERIHSTFSDYHELVIHFESSLRKLDFQQENAVSLNEQCDMLVFVRKRFWSLDCVVLIKVEELTENMLNLTNEKFIEFYSSYSKVNRMSEMIYFIPVICVDRITPPFREFINNNIKQELNKYKLPVGVSFGSNTIYIAKQKDGFAITKYKKLRKQFLEIINYIHS